MKSKKKKLVSGLAIVLIVFCVLLIAASLTVNLLFKNKQSTPHLMGYDVFLNTETLMEPVVHQDAAVRFEQPSLYNIGDVVVYQAATGALHVSRIARLDNATPDAKQTLDVINTLGQTEALTIDAVKGRCVDENVTLGKILLFATSKLGIVLLLVLPCVFLLIYAISRFVAAAQDDDDDEPLPTEGTVGMGRGRHSQSPLFTPEEASRKDKEFEDKKASLAEHFKQKSGDTIKMPRQKRKEKTDDEDAKRTTNEAAPRRKEKPAEAPAKSESSADVDARVAAIRQAMEQRAQERRKQEEEEAQAIAASKARAARQSAEVAEEQPVIKHEAKPAEAPARPARKPEAEAPARKPAEQPKPAAKPAPRPAAKPQAKRPASRPSAGPTSFEELMAKLDEEKNKLNGSR